MKKTAKWLALVVGLLTVVFTSCGNSFTNATVTGPGVGKGKTVTLYATSESDIVLFAESVNETARTIMPGTIDGTTGYKFYLWGTDKLGILSNAASTALGLPAEVTFTAASGSTTKGTVNLDLEVSQYELNLAVLPSTATAPTQASDALAAAVLYATATVDFRSSDSVNFFLSPYRLTAGGGVSLTLYADGWDVPSTHTVTVGIYDVNTDAAITGADEDTAFGLGKGVANAAVYASTGTQAVTPGTYNFVVDLVPKPDSGLKAHYYYSDKIVILSNQVTTETIPIPNIITEKPTTPEKLGVFYLDPLSATDDTYEVQFVWTDKSYNEENFILELLDFTAFTDALDTSNAATITALSTATGAAATALDTEWGDSKMTVNGNLPAEILYTFGKTVSKKTSNNAAVPGDYFYNNPEFWVDGSFNKNSSYAVLRLPLGHRYFARLCAVNDIGKSDYLYADISGTTLTAAANAKDYKRYGAIDVAKGDLKNFGADSKAINRFRITYNLNEGTFYEKQPKASAKEDKLLAEPNAELTGIKDISADKQSIVKYNTQKAANGTGIATILNPLHAPDTTATPNYAMLLDGDMNKWTNWLENSVNGTIYAASNGYFTAAKFSDSSTDAVWTEAEYTGYKNLSLYATYRISKANASIDASSDYNITDKMVQVYSNTSTTLPGSPTALTATNGVYVFVNSTSADANAGTATPAKCIFVGLVNDKTNNVVNNTGVAYDKIVMEVLKNGNFKKQTALATATATVGWTYGKLADGSSSTSANINYVSIPISAFAAGKYAVQIHAYANTQQGEYTRTIYFEVRDPS